MAAQPKIPVIFGPTASGKSALALQLAQKLNGEIINADSRQIYRYMPIISACPSAEDYAQIPHHLFEIFDPKQRCSAVQWAKLADEKITEIIARGKTPIIVGGTGFYLRALMEGMSPVPEVDPAIEAKIMAMPATERLATLKDVDPALAAKLHVSDTQRVVRALSVWMATGKPLSTWQAQPGQGSNWQFVKIGILPERAELHRRIEARWQTMLVQGVEQELRNLQKLGYTAQAPGLQGLGIAAFFHFFNGKLSQTQALQAGIAAHRQYAKRQVTWLRNSYRADVLMETANLTTALLHIPAAG